MVVLGPVAVGLVAVGLGLSFSASPTLNDQPQVFEASTILHFGDTALPSGIPTLVTTTPLLEDVINDLELSLTVSQLRDKVSGFHIRDSSLVQITVKDSDRDFAIDLANEVAQSLVDQVLALQEAQITLSQEELSKTVATLGLDSAGSVALADAIARLNGIAKQPVVVTPAEVLNDLEVVEAPQVLLNNTTRNLFLGMFLGGVLSVLLVVGLEYRKNPVGSPAQLESRFGLTHLGTLPRWRKRKNQLQPLLVDANSSSKLMEKTRQLATSVGLTIEGLNINTLAIVSPDFGDGCILLASNLAVALADTWKNVVLVDADLRSPSLHRQFDADNTVGLSNFLANSNLEVGAILQETRYNRLRIIPSGPIPENPVQLLSSPQMKGLLSHLKETSDVVLMTTPPLLAVTDGAVISSQVEGVVLLVNGHDCRVESVRTAITNLERAGTPILGYVWNG